MFGPVEKSPVDGPDSVELFEVDLHVNVGLPYGLEHVHVDLVDGQLIDLPGPIHFLQLLLEFRVPDPGHRLVPHLANVNFEQFPAPVHICQLQL